MSMPCRRRSRGACRAYDGAVLSRCAPGPGGVRSLSFVPSIGESVDGIPARSADHAGLLLEIRFGLLLHRPYRAVAKRPPDEPGAWRKRSGRARGLHRRRAVQGVVAGTASLLLACVPVRPSPLRKTSWGPTADYPAGKWGVGP